MVASEKIAKCANDKPSTSSKFLILLIIGFFIILVGIIVLIVTALLYGEGSASFGGVIFIWFIPIVFGAGPEATWLILFAIILAVLSIIIFLILRRGPMKTDA